MSVITGCIDAIAGGGGLITVPVLLAMGLPPVTALGTNRLQGCIGELTASLRFMHSGLLKLKEIGLGIFVTIIGATIGTRLAQTMHPDLLRRLIPILLVCVFIYTLLVPKIKYLQAKPRLSKVAYYLIFGLVIGAYNGFLGPGTGSFWTAAFMYFLGFNIQQATVYTKPLNFIGNVASLVIFISGGHVFFPIAIAMGIGQVVGAMVGSHLVVKKGSGFIRPVFLAVVGVMIVSLIVKMYIGAG